MRWRLAVRLGSILILALVGASYVALAAAHVDDRYRVDFVSGTWLALSDYTSRGTLFPPAYEDGYYGGTRYMPLPVLLDAAGFELTGDLLVGAKLATYAVAAALLAIAFAVLRLVRCPPLLALALLAALLVTPTGLVGTLGLRNDGLAVVLQLGAVAVVLRRQTNGSVALAGALAATAIFAKVSAVWAAAAIAIWIVANRRAVLGPFVAAFAGALASLTVLFELLSEGRFLSQLASYTFVGSRGPASVLTDGVQAVLTNFIASADAVWLLFPIAAVAVAWKVRSRAPTLFQLALAVDVVVLCVVMSSRGTDHNHLLDLCVLTVLAVGELAGERLDAENRVVRVLAAVAVVWGLATSYQRTMGPETKGALRGASETSLGLEPNPLAGLVDEGDTLLSEDPTIPLLLGQRPILLDSFIARATLGDDPELARRLARRVAAREFDAIILVAGLAPGTGLFDRQFLGRTVNDAVLGSYRLGYVERDIYVYVPGDS
jgi:hypothetical protein